MWGKYIQALIVVFGMLLILVFGIDLSLYNTRNTCLKDTGVSSRSDQIPGFIDPKFDYGPGSDGTEEMKTTIFDLEGDSLLRGRKPYKKEVTKEIVYNRDENSYERKTLFKKHRKNPNMSTNRDLFVNNAGSNHYVKFNNFMSVEELKDMKKRMLKAGKVQCLYGIYDIQLLFDGYLDLLDEEYGPIGEVKNARKLLNEFYDIYALPSMLPIMKADKLLKMVYACDELLKDRDLDDFGKILKNVAHFLENYKKDLTQANEYFNDIELYYLNKP